MVAGRRDASERWRVKRRRGRRTSVTNGCQLEKPSLPATAGHDFTFVRFRLQLPYLRLALGTGTSSESVA